MTLVIANTIMEEFEFYSRPLASVNIMLLFVDYIKASTFKVHVSYNLIRHAFLSCNRDV